MRRICTVPTHNMLTTLVCRGRGRGERECERECRLICFSSLLADRFRKSSRPFWTTQQLNSVSATLQSLQALPHKLNSSEAWCHCEAWLQPSKASSKPPATPTNCRLVAKAKCRRTSMRGSRFRYSGQCHVEHKSWS